MSENEALQRARQKAAYIRGLSEGEGDPAADPRDLRQLTATVVTLTDALADTEHRLDQMDEYVQELDSALWELEEDFYGDPETEADEDLVEWEITCPTCSERIVFMDQADAAADTLLEITCPTCAEVIWEEEDGSFRASDFEYGDAEDRDYYYRLSQGEKEEPARGRTQAEPRPQQPASRGRETGGSRRPGEGGDAAGGAYGTDGGDAYRGDGAELPH